jgi:hypothetical protein
MMETQQERRFVSAAAATAAVGVGVALYCAWQARARKLAAKEGGPPAEACPEVVPPKELSPSVNSGYLVASVKPEDGFAGYIPEDTDADGPPSTDEEESEPSVDSEISPPVLTRSSQTWTSFRGKKEEREGSFRKRSDEKVHRAQMIKASSSSLTSFICTPAQHNRSVESLHERKLALEPQTPPPAGSRTMASTHRRFKDGAAEHPKRASTLGLAIPEFRGRAASIAASARPSLPSIEDSTHGKSPTTEGEHEARAAAVVAAMAVMGEASRASSAGEGKVVPPEALPPSAASPRLPRLNPKVKSTGLADFDSLSKMSKAKR